MYQSTLHPRKRGLTLAAIILAHVAAIYAALTMTGVVPAITTDDLTQLIDISDPPLPPAVEIELPDDAMPEKEGAASAKNIESQATPVAAPKPRIDLPVPPPMPVTETPKEGSDPTQGASDVVGPGTGAGGVGTGTGSGGSGSGTGGGGSGQGTRPVLATPGLTIRDFPPEMARRLPRNGAVFTILRVGPDGRVTECRIGRSSGDRAVDDWTCNLIVSRLRFNPARDGNGRPIADFYGYAQQFRTR